MITKARRLLTILALGLAIMACAGTLPVQNVDGAPITTGTGKPATLDAVQRAIVRAGSGLNMRMTVVSPGVVQAVYAPRDFSATFEITYTVKNYNIHYKTSDHLNYDPATNTIHKSYNSWVANLQRRIDNELSAL